MITAEKARYNLKEAREMAIDILFNISIYEIENSIDRASKKGYDHLGYNMIKDISSIEIEKIRDKLNPGKPLSSKEIVEFMAMPIKYDLTIREEVIRRLRVALSELGYQMNTQKNSKGVYYDLEIFWGEELS